MAGGALKNQRRVEKGSHENAKKVGETTIGCGVIEPPTGIEQPVAHSPHT